MGVEGATSPFQIPCSGSRTYYSFGEKNCLKKMFFSFRARRALSNDSSPVLLGAIVSETKIFKEKCFFPLLSLNCYSSAPIGPIWTKKIGAAQRVLSNDPGPVLLGAIVSEKKIFPLNRYNSAPIGSIKTKKIWA
ncbi:LOW QUALITY PROTEIN: hypothetical protein V1477_006456 [Vespula maculifrons]|uniref:Uncharacterized protein n=1 Tax=Vespula maculifrons TaxID=7453 RepID=A0ABD2CKS3_VESMC